MATEIKCPNCGHPFLMEEAVSEEYRLELRKKMEDFVRAKEIEYKSKSEDFSKKESQWLQQTQQKEFEFSKKLNEEKIRLQQSIEENLRKSISSDFENKLKIQEQINLDHEEKLKEARQKELDYLKKEQILQNKEAELEIQIQKRIQEERTNLSEQIRRQEQEKVSLKEVEYQLRQKELEKQLDDQKKLVDEMKRKQEQGSMQLQGESQELLLEDLLKNAFPFDLIEEVGKGVKGADCILTVRNQFGQECGKIIFESKRTKEFQVDWIEKLKSDMRSLGAEIAVIVTQVYPRDMERFGERNGVWICNFVEVRALVQILREGIIKVFNATKTLENKDDKVQLLYGYLTGNEFAEQWKAIREGFMKMKIDIQRERDAMERLWKAREKSLEKVLLNAAHIRGAIDGIAGQDSIDLNLLEDNEQDNLLGG